MANKKDPLIKVDLSSPFSVKAEIKAEVPSQSTGRLIDALTDAIRPFTERRGLKADMIRLQREDILLEIARKASERLSLEGVVPGKVPNKFLIPFLEKASTEDEGDLDLIDKWSNLLVSASTEYSSSHIRFASILAEMGAREVKMLERYCSSSRSRASSSFIVDAPIDGRAVFLSESFFASLDALVAKSEGAIKQEDVDKLIDDEIRENEGPGFIIDNIYLNFRMDGGPDIADGELGSIEASHPAFPSNVADDELALSIIENLGLVKTELFSFDRARLGGYIKIIHLTRFGLEFYLACNPIVAREVKKSLEVE